MLRQVQCEVSVLEPTGSQVALYLLEQLDKTLNELERNPSPRKRLRLERRARDLQQKVEARDDWSPPDVIIHVGRESVRVDSQTFLDSEDTSESIPIRLGALTKGKTLWRFRGKYYAATDDELTYEDVRALVNQAANARRLKLEKAHALEAMRERLDERGRREPIPQEVKILVWQRDQGRCVECGSSRDLEYDHIIPLAMGGSNTARNLQLLCAPCNRRKGATLG